MEHLIYTIVQTPKGKGGILLLLSTSTNILCERPGGRRVTIQQSMQAARDAGFEVLDINFYDWSRPNAPFLSSGWEQWLEDTAEYAQGIGVSFHQSHLYCYNYADCSLSPEDCQYQQQLTERSILCMERLGVQVAVVHPETAFARLDISKASQDAVCRQIDWLLKLTHKSGILLAVENMCDYDIHPRRRYCSQPEELLALVTKINDKRVGICWDFEHGSIMQLDQQQVIHYLGKNLMALHIAESMSNTDGSMRHTMPIISGRIDWPPIMEALQTVGYKGAFSFEAHNYSNRIPDQLIPQALAFAYSIGQYLVNISEP